MGKRYAPKFDGSEAQHNFYTGPPPVPGLYKGKIDSIALGVIKSGKPENVGQDRLSIMVSITEGKYAGARILTGLNLVPDGAANVNDFLASLTDGSEEAIKAVKQAFWKEKKMLVADETDDYGNYPVIRIGKYVFAKGVQTAFETRMRPDREGNDRADIRRWVTPLQLADEGDESDDLSDDDDTDIVDSDGDSEGDVVEADDSDSNEGEAVVADDDDDEDDPWSDDD